MTTFYKESRAKIIYFIVK